MVPALLYIAFIQGGIKRRDLSMTMQERLESRILYIRN